jgi:hypothetical protein
MNPVLLAFLAAAVAGATAAGVFLCSRLLFRDRPEGIPAGPALAAGYAAGHVVVAGIPRGLPAEAWQWLLPVAVVAAALGHVQDRLTRRDPWWRWALFPAVALGFAAASYPAGTVMAACLFALAFVALREVLRNAARRAGPRPFLAALAVTAGAAAASCVVSGWMLLGQAAGGLAAAAAACFLLAGRFPASAAGAVPVAALLLGGILLDGSLYAELPRASAVLLAAAPLGAWAPAPRGEVRPLRAALLRVGLVALLAGAALAVAVACSPPMDY